MGAAMRLALDSISTPDRAVKAAGEDGEGGSCGWGGDGQDLMMLNTFNDKLLSMVFGQNTVALNYVESGEHVVDFQCL